MPKYHADKGIQQETQRLPDWGKVEFYKYPAKGWDDILKGASTKARDLVSQLVCYESNQRLSAEEVCESRKTEIRVRVLRIADNNIGLETFLL